MTTSPHEMPFKRLAGFFFVIGRFAESSPVKAAITILSAIALSAALLALAYGIADQPKALIIGSSAGLWLSYAFRVIRA
jgi:hypothetical protein